MARNGSRENALRDLLGANGASAELDYPAAATLPAEIHTRLLEAIEATKDGSERSMDFFYERDRWTGGVVVSEIRKTAFYLHTLGSVVRRPDIFAHTHSADVDSLEAQRERWNGSELSGAEQFVARAEREIDFRRSVYTLPSPQDVRTFAYRSPGTVGNIVASEGGNFLFLMANIQRLGLENWLESVRSKEERERILTTLEEIVEAREANTSPAGVREMVLAGIARAVGKKFVCYFSEDPDNPQMTRIDADASATLPVAQAV